MSSSHIPATIQAESFQGNINRIKSTASFHNLVQAEKPRVVFSLATAPEIRGNAVETLQLLGPYHMPGDALYMLLHGAACAVIGSGFSDYAALADALSRGFPNNQEYQEALEREAADCEQLQETRHSGFATYPELRAAREQGLEDLFHCWQENRLRFTAAPKAPTLAKFVGEECLERGGFTGDHAAAKSAYQAGFWQRETWEAALAAGFTDSRQFLLAQKYDISDPDELTELLIADVLNIKSLAGPPVQEIQHCLELMREAKERNYRDLAAYVLLTEVAHRSLPEGNIPLETWVVRAFRNHHISEPIARKLMAVSAWWSSFENDHVLPPEIAQYLYLHEGGVYARQYSESERKAAVLDVMNILLEGCDNNDEDKIGTVSQLQVIVDRLRSWGYEHITGIADASFPYHVSETEYHDIESRLNELILMTGNEIADPAILRVAEKHSSVIVTNDQYRDWVNDRHPWRQENLPRILLHFRFDDEGNVDFGQKGSDLSSYPHT
ncbi:NYN domain-containing protein [Spirochaeta africana]|uniref:Zc3h12a-like Ribonuclease domain protein n=1 Tax=Spirochaeta africana (strain ATCC 700263 / DSM 8902 / Z-7692) TaxID=889378 RepID=H9UHI2_SPIAZ|nr:Zc3h12a-like Ribonuclease [Spirochaeta africana]AFG36975.1 Zc3h12a-like Ribonuclease domain protein [Spirochaeta africana DSM 8902]